MTELRRILVVKLADIGDVLLATPALRALHQTFPQAHIDVLVPPHSAEILVGSKLVDDLIRFDKHRYDRLVDALRPNAIADALRLAARLRQNRYDAVIILHHLTTRWGTLKYLALALASGAKYRAGLDNGRGWFLTHRARDLGFGERHEVEYALDVVGTIGACTSDLSLDLTISPEDETYASRITNHESRIIAIHPGSGDYSLARRWSPEGFAQVADALVERHGARIVLLGGPDEGDVVAEVASRMRHQALNLAGRTTLKQLAAVLGRCTLFVGNDSGVMHIAAAVETPVVAIFGPTNHQAWGPWDKSQISNFKCQVVRVELACSPCFYRRFDLGTPQGCAGRDCLARITPEMVIDAVETLGVFS